ncbi:MAG: hypothetical protein AMXMBFR56_76260 [Polyangiaceae bacterium]
MQSTRHWLAGSLVIGAWMVFGVSCGGAQQVAEAPAAPAVEETKPAEEAPRQAASGCADSSGEAKQCTTNEECCAGYVCSLDPERSHVTRYCLEG